MEIWAAREFQIFPESDLALSAFVKHFGAPGAGRSNDFRVGARRIANRFKRPASVLVERVAGTTDCNQEGK
jgi:hypothetical protein